jgi:hypothetical protein
MLPPTPRTGLAELTLATPSVEIGWMGHAAPPLGTVVEMLPTAETAAAAGGALSVARPPTALAELPGAIPSVGHLRRGLAAPCQATVETTMRIAVQGTANLDVPQQMGLAASRALTTLASDQFSATAAPVTDTVATLMLTVALAARMETASLGQPI